MMTGGSKEQMFSSAPEDTIIGQLWTNKFQDKSKSLTHNLESQLSVIKDETYVLFGYLSVMKNMEGYKNCYIISTGFAVKQEKLAIAFPKGSPYTDLFNHALMKMIESGHLQRIIIKYSKVCQKSNESNGKLCPGEAQMWRISGSVIGSKQHCICCGHLHQWNYWQCHNCCTGDGEDSQLCKLKPNRSETRQTLCIIRKNYHLSATITWHNNLVPKIANLSNQGAKKVFFDDGSQCIIVDFRHFGEF